MFKWVPRPLNGGSKLFSTNGAGTTGIPVQQNGGGLCPTLYIKINSKWIEHLNTGTWEVQEVQWVEHVTLDGRVVGSSAMLGTEITKK